MKRFEVENEICNLYKIQSKNYKMKIDKSEAEDKGSF
jgi:hypothetical protein